MKTKVTALAKMDFTSFYPHHICTVHIQNADRGEEDGPINLISRSISSPQSQRFFCALRSRTHIAPFHADATQCACARIVTAESGAVD